MVRASKMLHVTHNAYFTRNHTLLIRSHHSSSTSSSSSSCSECTSIQLQHSTVSLATTTAATLLHSRFAPSSSGTVHNSILAQVTIAHHSAVPLLRFVHSTIRHFCATDVRGFTAAHFMYALIACCTIYTNYPG